MAQKGARKGDPHHLCHVFGASPWFWRFVLFWYCKLLLCELTLRFPLLRRGRELLRTNFPGFLKANHPHRRFPMSVQSIAGIPVSIFFALVAYLVGVNEVFPCNSEALPNARASQSSWHLLSVPSSLLPETQNKQSISLPAVQQTFVKFLL